MIINRIRPEMVRRGEMMSVEDVEDILAVPLIGIIPDDEHVVIATNQGEAIAGSSAPSGQAFDNISRRLTGEEIPFPDLTVRKGFFHRLFRR